MFLTILSNSFKEELLENGETRTVLENSTALAPIKAAILPLTKKDGLPEKAREIIKFLQLDLIASMKKKILLEKDIEDTML